ncbi:beta-ketoacyl synthase N-terminal-like domain-containing protein [Phormidesmis sp. 146-20]
MSTSRIDPILAQLHSEVGNFEKALLELIKSKNKKKARSETLVDINKTNRQLKSTPIAIIGMASLFPEAKNLQEYWDNIMREVDCITEVPSSRWDVDEFYDPDPKAQDKTYCKRGGFIPDIDFNPMEFGLPPNILEFTDVSQLVSLVIAKKAMEDAGYGETRQFDRDQAGVILGAAVGRPLSGPLTARMQYPVWEKVLKNSGLSDEDTRRIVQKIKLAYLDWEENSFPGMLTNVIAGRIANRLDFGGTNCAIDAACASSLSAFKMAVSELSEHRANLMLTGGIDIDNSIVTYLCFSKTPALSKRQESRPFDAESDGMLVGEGVGMLVLKRLEDAERDGDRIYAVIRGIGSSSDGRYKSIYAPRPEGQARALRRAYEEAGFSPATVGLIEAHGTGTAAGDPAEFSALDQVFREADAEQQSIALGSVKSQIGHTKAAAGAASLIKAVLALHHKILPATINITSPNPKLGIQTSPFYLNTRTRPWIRPAGEPPRRAGVSSFGFGGTNFHIVLEEYQAEHQQSYRLHSTIQTLLLTAATPEKLLQHCQTILQTLQSEGGDRDYLAIVNASKHLTLEQNAARLGFVAGSRSEACNLLQISIEQLQKNLTLYGWNHPQGIYYRKSGMVGKVVALFSGQGSQYLEMGRELTLNFPTLREGLGEMDRLMIQDGLTPLSEVVFPVPTFESQSQQDQVAALQRTDYAQPAIGIFSSGLYKLLQQAGFQPDFVAGHSFGELTALWAAGVLGDGDYYRLIKARGQAMATPLGNSDAGGMLAVKGDVSRIEALIQPFPQVTIANLNSPQQVVLAGARSEIAKVQSILQEQGLSAIALPVAAAFHTPLVAHAQKPFAQAVESVTFANPKIPVYTNVTGKQYPPDAPTIQKILKEHLINKVYFRQEIEAIYADGGFCFVEFGPKNVLTNLVKEILADQPHEAIALNANWRKDSDRQLREAAVQLRVVGLPLGDFDPYPLERITPEVSPRAKALNVRLTATNYISEKTRMAFDMALQDGHKVTLAIPEAIVMDRSLEVVSTTDSSRKADLNSKKVLQSTKPAPKEQSQNGHATNGHATNGHARNEPPKDEPLKEQSQNGHSAQTIKAVAQEAVAQKVTQKMVDSVPLDRSAPQHSQPKTTTSKPEPVSIQPPSEPKGLPMSNLPLHYQRILESLESSLTEFSHRQQDILQVHEQYLQQHIDYAQAFLDLTQQQNALFGNSDTVTPQAQTTVAESLERSMTQFHQHHGETLRVHDRTLQHQADHTRSFFEVLHYQYSGLVSGEVASEQPSRHNGAKVLQEKVAVLSDTISASYSQEIATPANITPKAVPPVRQPEAIAQPIAKNGALKVSAAESFKVVTTVESLQQDIPKVVQSTVAKAEVPKVEVPKAEAPKVEVPKVEVPKVEVPKVEVLQQSEPKTDEMAALVDALLEIVSEKTGYPAEMLELDLDMEADLGIDSIKRVEIMGTMQQQFPDYPVANPEDLGELRTLGQIIEQMRQVALVAVPTTTKSDTKSEDTSLPAVNNHTGVLEVESAKVVVTKEVEPTVSDPDNPTLDDLSALVDALLAIVSEKTGYPAEMLELDLDMEADLGIDSIKRVEIMGTMQQQFPDYPVANPEDLGELRTLRQIVEQMKQTGTEKKTIQAPILANSPA